MKMMLLRGYKCCCLCLPSQPEDVGRFYNESSSFHSAWENMMGNSLHNKIQLGRTSVLGSLRSRAVLALGACVSIGLAWLAMRASR
jgi:hypothetical protein